MGFMKYIFWGFLGAEFIAILAAALTLTGDSFVDAWVWIHSDWVNLTLIAALSVWNAFCIDKIVKGEGNLND